LSASSTTPPEYLEPYLARHDDPRDAGRQWFREAKFGLFLHYGLYSLLGRHEWVQLKEKIPVTEYARLAEQFRADAFNAPAIADLAVEAGCRYVNLTTQHHEGFSLWDTRQSDFKSTNTPCGRDLVAELAAACADRKLGLCLYLSHGREWRHPHGPSNDRFGGRARPEYDPPDPHYAAPKDHDLNLYVDYTAAQVDELLTNYGPIAAIWLDGIAVPREPKDADGHIRHDYHPARDGDPFRCQELYDLVHAKQPWTLVAYKYGYLGTEDFVAHEHSGQPSSGKPCEICTTMTPESWGWHKEMSQSILTVDQVLEKLTNANAAGSNLLLNTGPMPDGSIHPPEAEVLREAGRRLRRFGAADDASRCNS
jgi:alpha-L-fucosidase